MYPTGTDLDDLLVSQKLPVPLDSDRALRSVIAEWETRTGFAPFVAAADSSSVRFDPPLGSPAVLDLLGGFVSVTDVRLDVSGASPGVPLQPHEYEMLPLWAPGAEQGWRSIRFNVYPGGQPGSVQVTGRRGLVETCPDDVIEALLARAMARVVAKTGEGKGDLRREEYSDVRYEYDLAAGRSKVDRWNDEYEAAIARWARI